MFIEGEIPNVVTTTGGNSGFGSGFGGDWIWAFLIFALLGWGRGGFGSYGSTGGVGENYVLATDFATIERKLDSVNSGICDSTYALNNTITNGFANVQNTLCQGFSGVNLGLTTQGYETRLGINTLASQLADCCCEIKTALGDVKYSNANNTRDIIEAQNANYRAIHDELVANKIEAKNDRIAELTLQLSKADLKASQAAQNAYLLNELKPCPSAAYIVPNPNCCYDYSITRNGSCGNCGTF